VVSVRVSSVGGVAAATVSASERLRRRYRVGTIWILKYTCGTIYPVLRSL
jgi:hypothetical protein